MAMQVKQGLVGDKELLRVLDDMKAAGGRKVMRPAIQAGLTIIARAVRKGAPGTRLKRMVGTEVRTTYKKNVIGYVGIKEHGSDKIKIKGEEKDFAVVANFLEFGTPHIKARAFVRGARAAKGAAAMAAVRAKASERIDVEWAKANARHKTIWK